jgi:hypothetical protein
MLTLDTLKEKLRHARASATMWYGVVLTSMPEALQYAHDNYPDLQTYIPQSLQSPVFHLVGIGVLVCRFRTLGRK